MAEPTGLKCSVRDHKVDCTVGEGAMIKDLAGKINANFPQIKTTAPYTNVTTGEVVSYLEGLETAQKPASNSTFDDIVIFPSIYSAASSRSHYIGRTKNNTPFLITGSTVHLDDAAEIIQAGRQKLTAYAATASEAMDAEKPPVYKKFGFSQNVGHLITLKGDRWNTYRIKSYSESSDTYTLAREGQTYFGINPLHILPGLETLVTGSSTLFHPEYFYDVPAIKIESAWIPD